MVRYLKTKWGNDAVKQFVVTTNKGDSYFISYNVIVARRTKGKITLDRYYWDYSATTKLYLSQFLRHDIPTIRKMIANKEIKLAKLN